MIKNVIFDLVGVLMRFDTEGYYREHGIGAADQELLRREVFRSLEWALQDRGAISETAFCDAACQRLPERLHQAARDFIFRQNRDILPVEGMASLLRGLKGAGRRLLLLSNTSVGYHCFLPQVPGISLFDDVLISADVGLVKPDPAFFRLACERFGIVPSESIFIDDTPINAEAALFVGMRAIVFNGDADELREKLQMEGI